MSVDVWRSEDIPQSSGTLAVLAADAVLSRSYENVDGSRVDVSVIYFSQQQVNSQIHSPRNCIPGSGWKVEQPHRVRLSLNQDAVPATQMRIRRGARAQDVYYWFRTRSGPTASEYALKWDLVRNALANRPTNAAMIRFNAEVSDSVAMRHLMSLLVPSMNQILGQVGL